MKIRTGFVANSSSASFAIIRKFLSLDMFVSICNHGTLTNTYNA